jgi:transcriptional regulator with GAF, ATPase, and Fis domain
MLAANGALTGIHESPASTVARYEALIRVSEALRAYHDRDTLFPSLARELRPVVRFTFLGLGLYDEHTHSLDLRVLEATGNPLLPPELPAEESLTYWTVQHQAPLVISNVESETRFPKAMAYFRAQNVRSTLSLPLTTPRRRIGMLVAGDSQREAYDARDVTRSTTAPCNSLLSSNESDSETSTHLTSCCEPWQPCSMFGRCFRGSRKSPRRSSPTTC